MVTKRTMYISLSVVSLVLGCCVYIFLREHSDIGILFSAFPFVHAIQKSLNNDSLCFFRYYFSDFLWAFSLNCGLLAIYIPGKKGGIFCAYTTFLCGCVWELLQYLGIIAGTGDMFDVLLYLLAATLCTIINIRSEEK